MKSNKTCSPLAVCVTRLHIVHGILHYTNFKELYICLLKPSNLVSLRFWLFRHSLMWRKVPMFSMSKRCLIIIMSKPHRKSSVLLSSDFSDLLKRLVKFIVRSAFYLRYFLLDHWAYTRSQDVLGLSPYSVIEINKCGN